MSELDEKNGGRTGTLIIGSGPHLDAAFAALVAGLQSGARTSELDIHCEILLDALDQAARTPEGALFLQGRPKLKQQLAAYRRRSSQLSRIAKRRRYKRDVGHDKPGQGA
jgi:hypothetical protein